MLTVYEIIRRIRTRLHDTQSLEYDDEEIIDTINMAIRFIRRAIVSIRPSLLATKHEGTAEGDTIELTKRPLKIIHVTIGTEKIKTETTYNSDRVYKNYTKLRRNNQKLCTKKVTEYYSEHGIKQTELAHVIYKKSDKTGEPREFYLIGEKTIKLYPVPRGKIKYTVIQVDDFDELTSQDISPLPTDFDDFVVEYAAMRLSLENEFDMTQEQALTSAIYQQIQQTLMPPPAGFNVRSYW